MQHVATRGDERLRQRHRIGIDIGGTFTDFVIMGEEDGRIRLEKTPTTPGDIWRGILDGLTRAEVDLTEISMIIHGMTVGLNCFLEKQGDITGLITTRGFRDVYEIGRVNREEMYDLFYRKPEPLVPRELRIEVTERLDASGGILVPLREDEVVDAARFFRREGVTSVAVCLLHSYANPQHEQRVREILAQEYPEAQVTVSSELAREWREYERTSTTAINAYILRTVGDYLAKITAGLRDRGYARPFYVNQSSGGVMSVASAAGKPVHTLMSGPSGGVVSTAHIGNLLGIPNLISFDMGGTSTDVSVIFGGHTRITSEVRIERHPIMVPAVDIHSIGAGGGSVSWLSSMGVLSVGPKSAGAMPGPVCYGRGGTEPTVTDANLVLGRLPQTILGGRMSLDAEGARRSILEKVADPLGLNLAEAASGILRIVNTKMAYAIRAVTIQRGLDPKDFALVAFGGAGPMHACDVAAELDIPTIVVPLAPGAFSALGMVVSDVRHDFVRTSLRRTEEVDLGGLDALYAEMLREAESVMAGELPDGGEVIVERFIDMRYIGQEYSVRLPIPPGDLTRDILGAIRLEFDRLHERTYGHASPTEQTEIVSARVVSRGILRRPRFEELPSGGRQPQPGAQIGTVQAWFGEAQAPVEAAVFAREELLADNQILGPALVVEHGCTTVLNPEYRLRVDQLGNLIITREA